MQTRQRAGRQAKYNVAAFRLPSVKLDQVEVSTIGPAGVFDIKCRLPR